MYFREIFNSWAGGMQGKRIINRFAPKIAPSRENGLSKPQASLLHAFCACNYIDLPLARQHKTSVFVSRFAPSRYFYYKTNIMRLPWGGMDDYDKG